MSTDTVSTRTGVIHDLGYQPYTGDRYGRPAIVRTLIGFSLRSAFGLGRGARAKIVPVGVLALMCLPAIINAFIVARGGTRAFDYTTYSYALRAVALTIFLAAQAPELVSRDLRHRVLPLYFSRPLRPADYPLAKLAALIMACLVVVDVPLVLLYMGTIVGVHGPGAVWHQTTAVAPGLALGLLWSVVLATTALAIAAFSGRRAFAAGGVASFFFLTWVLSEVLTPITPRVATLVSPFSLLNGIEPWPAWGIGYVLLLAAVVAAALAALLSRYRKAVAS
jgi:ABC-2 type transport system permease protein